MLRWLVVFAALAFAANGLAAPDPSAEGARLMAQLKAASGGAALDAPAGFHEIGTGTRDGAAFSYETWGDLRQLKSVSSHTIGGHAAVGGFDGKITWAVGPDGAAHVDSSAEGLAGARLGTYLTIAGYFYPDRFPARFESRGRRKADSKSFDVVTVTPADSFPVDLWLDPATHLLQRISGTDGKVAFSGVVERYQTVDGVSIAFGLTQIEGTHRTVLKLTSFDFEVVPAERFAPPPSAK